MSFDLAAFKAENEPYTPDVLWEDAEDLSRLSIAALLAEQNPVRRDSSLGFLRLTGDGVTGHSANVEDVAAAIHHFQRLVHASGLALAGFKTVQGGGPADIAAKTRLALEGTPLPGSLVLQIVPAASPADEIMPDGQAEFFRSDEDQVVDSAVSRALDLLNLSKSVGPDADNSEFIVLLQESGPRVAGVLRDFAKSLADANFDTEVAWMQPRRPRQVSKLTTSELRRIGELVAARDLEKDPVPLRGIVHTVSDLTPLRVELPSGDLISVTATAIPEATIKSLKVGMTVEIMADVTEEVAPGSEPKTKYTATTLTVLDNDTD